MIKEKPEGFVPLFKEKSNAEQFMFDDDQWHPTNETTIMSMWSQWGKRKDGYKYEDEDGFFVYGFIKDKQEE
jgi:hypothetical protein